jgi:hypothetical protein
MAQKNIDVTANENLSVTLGKIQANFDEVYSSGIAFDPAAPGAIGGTTPAAGTFTTLTGSTVTSTGLATAGSAKLDTGTKTASATAGAATLNKNAGVITSEALTTAAGSEYTLTLTNSTIAAADQVFVALQNGTNTTYPIYVTTVTPGSGSAVIKVLNGNGSAAALNGTIKIAFMVLKN